MITLAEAIAPQTRYTRALDAAWRTLDRLIGQTWRETLGMIADVRRAVLDALAGAIDAGGSLPIFRLRGVRTAVDTALREFGGRFGGVLARASRDAAGLGGTMQRDALAAAGIDVGVRPVAALVDAATEMHGLLIQRVTVEANTRIAQSVQRAASGAITPSQAQREIAEILRTQPDRLTRRLGSVATQAQRIVDTELAGIAAQADAEQDEELGETRGLLKWWRTVNDSRVRPDHRAAQARYSPSGSPGPIPLKADFSVGGEAAKGPHDPRLSSKQRVRCRCQRALHHREWES